LKPLSVIRAEISNPKKPEVAVRGPGIKNPYPGNSSRLTQRLGRCCKTVVNMQVEDYYIFASNCTRNASNTVSRAKRAACAVVSQLVKSPYDKFKKIN
jgi:hypothetical protein